MTGERTQTRGQDRWVAIGALEPTMVRVSPRWRPWNRSNELICYINVTGLVSILFVLLVAFMVIRVPVCFSKCGSVDLAKVGHPIAMPGADREDALLIAVTRDGKVFFGRDPVVAESLSPRIREGLARGAERKVYLKADARVKYGYVKEVLDGVHDAGVEKVGFIVEQRTTPASIP